MNFARLCSPRSRPPFRRALRVLRLRHAAGAGVREYPDVYRSNEAGQAFLPLMFAGMFVAMLVATMIYAKGYEGGSGVAEGVRFGVPAGRVRRLCVRRRELRDAEHRQEDRGNARGRRVLRVARGRHRDRARLQA